MSTRAKSRPAASRPAPPPRTRTAIPALGLDPWAWACLAALLVLVVHSIRAPLGEPVAEDFDFIHRVLFTGNRSLLDGGGSTAFWRPIPHQLYYWALTPVILRQPGLIAVLHTALLGVATLWIYVALRRALPRPLAAATASFVLLSESSRMLLSWPGLIVDLGLWFFVALAIRETAARRLPTALAALLGALLCKEVAVVAALLLPWMPGVGPEGRRERIRWTLWVVAVVMAWVCAYLAVRSHAHLILPHKLETDPAILGTPIPVRLGWAFSNSVKALFSLPAAPVRRGFVIALAAGVWIAWTAHVLSTDPEARRRLVRLRPWIVWGALWFAGATATLVAIYPLWAPNRSGFASLGFGVALAAFGWAARPWLLAALVALRLVAFGLSPGPPQAVSPNGPQTGAFMDFEQLARLQRMMREVRQGLASQYARLPAGSGAGYLFMPRRAEYAFGGDRALRIWYRDSTLRWVGITEFERHPGLPLATIVEYEANARPQWAWVHPDAMRHVLRGSALHREGRSEKALAEFDAAEAMARNTGASRFVATVAAFRAITLIAEGQVAAAEYEANRAIDLFPAHPDAHYALAEVRYAQGRMDDARAELQLALAGSPGHAGARNLERRLGGSP